MPEEPGADRRTARARFLTTAELVAEAKRRLPAAAWDWVCGGAESESTVARNRSALDAVCFRPRVLRNVEDTNVRAEFLGRERALPVLLAPLGGLTVIDREGALPLARAAAEFGCLMMLSSVTEPPLEEVAKLAGEQLIYQLYVHGNERWVFEQVKRAHAAGCGALCVTVDVPHFGRRERSLIGRHSIPGRPFDAQRVGEEFAMRADWRLVDKIKKKLEVPLILKGISTAEDAQLALEHGVDVIYVSNHGGRQLDYARGAIEILPEVVSVARRKAKIIVDGGFLRGTDVVKALAMGADLVGFGRLPALALGAAGEAGVLRMLEILRSELEVTLKLLGVHRYAELDGSFLHPTVPAAWTDPFGTFRHLPGRTE